MGTAADLLGFWTYLVVVGGGVPDREAMQAAYDVAPKLSPPEPKSRAKNGGRPKAGPASYAPARRRASVR